MNTFFTARNKSENSEIDKCEDNTHQVTGNNIFKFEVSSFQNPLFSGCYKPEGVPPPPLVTGDPAIYSFTVPATDTEPIRQIVDDFLQSDIL